MNLAALSPIPAPTESKVTRNQQVVPRFPESQTPDAQRAVNAANSQPVDHPPSIAAQNFWGIKKYHFVHDLRAKRGSSHGRAAFDHDADDSRISKLSEQSHPRDLTAPEHKPPNLGSS